MFIRCISTPVRPPDAVRNFARMRLLLSPLQNTPLVLPHFPCQQRILSDLFLCKISKLRLIVIVLRRLKIRITTSDAGRSSSRIFRSVPRLLGSSVTPPSFSRTPLDRHRRSPRLRSIRSARFFLLSSWLVSFRYKSRESSSIVISCFNAADSRYLSKVSGPGIYPQ